MACKRHTPVPILAKLRDADLLHAGSQSIPDIARKLEVGEETYHRWSVSWRKGSSAA